MDPNSHIRSMGEEGEVLTLWQVFQRGVCYIACEYNSKGYTGRWAYVGGYADAPKPENIQCDQPRGEQAHAAEPDK